MLENLNLKLDSELSKKISGGPEFATQIASLASGKEIRNIARSFAKHRYFIDLAELGEREINRLKTMFLNCLGMAKTFTIKDWNDFHAEQCLQGVGNGTKTSFEIKKIYKINEYNYERRIKNIVENSVHVFVDGVEQQSGFNINYTDGCIEFNNPVAINKQVKVSFDFEVRVRFNNDFLNIIPKSKLSNSTNKIELLEVV